MSSNININNLIVFTLPILNHDRSYLWWKYPPVPASASLLSVSQAKSTETETDVKNPSALAPSSPSSLLPRGFHANWKLLAEISPRATRRPFDGRERGVVFPCARVKTDFPPQPRRARHGTAAAPDRWIFTRSVAHTPSQDSAGSWLLIGCARRAFTSVSAPSPRVLCPCASSHCSPERVARRLR